MILCLSASHKKANVPMLEALGFKDRKMAALGLLKLNHVEEAVLLQTCNRVEIYVVGSEPSEYLMNRLIKYWSKATQISRDLVLKTVEVFLNREALMHLLRVASGLESMVVGENEILGQVRTAYVDAKQNGTIGPILEKSFMKAINVGKKVRVKTRINKGLTSISSIAVQMAQQFFSELNEVKALLVGAGKAGTLVAEELKKKGNYKILVANRTFNRGKKLAEKIGGTAISLEEVPKHLSSMNLVITATYSKNPLLKVEHFQDITQKYRNPKLLIVDISQPRCVEDKVGRLPYIELKNIDDIKRVAESNIKIRDREKRRVEKTIEKELKHLQMLITTIVAEPVVSKLCVKAEEVRKKEFLHATRRLRGISEEQRKIVEDLTKVLTRRLLQPAIENLRLASMDQNSLLLTAAEDLFSLGPKGNRKRKDNQK